MLVKKKGRSHDECALTVSKWVGMSNNLSNLVWQVLPPLPTPALHCRLSTSFTLLFAVHPKFMGMPAVGSPEGQRHAKQLSQTKLELWPFVVLLSCRWGREERIESRISMLRVETDEPCREFGYRGYGDDQEFSSGLFSLGGSTLFHAGFDDRLFFQLSLQPRSHVH
jgi:hypothetical protein